MVIYRNYKPEEIKVDTSKRTVEAIASRMGIVDLGNDIIHEGAFKRTLKARLPKQRIKFMFGHRELLGLMTHAEEEGDKLLTVNKIDTIQRGDEVLTHIEAGTLNEMSIGFDIPRGKSEIKAESEEENAPIIRHIHEVELFENSIVMWGMNPETAVLGVKMANQVGINSENIDHYMKNISEAEKMESNIKHSILSMLSQIKISLDPPHKDSEKSTPVNMGNTQEKELLDLTKEIEQIGDKLNGK